MTVVYDDDSVVAQKVYMEENDASYARKVEQELMDEDLARQLAQAEERALQTQERSQGPPPSRPWTTRRACSFCIPLVIVVVGVVALMYAMQNDETGSSPNLGNFGDPGKFWEDEDPWEGLQPGEVVKWRNGGSGGLQLEVLDALEPKWEDLFLRAVNEWDDGDPDSLDLTTSKVSHDPECEPIDSKFKVCNGNYGDSQWRGINQVLIQNGFIVSTTSKMNEYYLAKASTAQKQYTMCHEIGHGFGLPHSDEDFFNKDLGNCMDYTSNPEDNQSPDVTNYEFLQDLYGTLPSGVRGRRELERTLLKRRVDSSSTGIPDGIRTKLHEIVPQLENRVDGNAHEDGWRLLHQTEHGESHEFELGDGWTVQLHKLLVVSDPNL